MFQYDCDSEFFGFASFPNILFPTVKEFIQNIHFPFAEYGLFVFCDIVCNSVTDLSHCVHLLHQTETGENRERSSYVGVVGSRYKLNNETNDVSVIKYIKISSS